MNRPVAQAPAWAGRRVRPAPSPPPLADPGGELHGFVVLAVIGFLILLAAVAFYDVRFLPVVLAAGAVPCLAVPVIRWPVLTSAVWLLVAGTSPEMWLGDLIGQEGTITAVVKVLGLILVIVCMLRYGARFDPFNPAFAFLAMFVTGLAHGLWPTLTLMDSARSLIGGAAPFAFSFSRLSRRWCNAIIAATIWLPTVIVGFGQLLALAHLRGMFTYLEGVMRLQASTHPAFLGGFAAVAVYAGLVELYRDGRNQRLWMIAVNLVILALSGARAPLACAMIVAALALFCLPSPQFPLRRRVGFVLAGLVVLPVLFAMASGSSAIRLLHVLSTDARELSGRDVIWPYFEDAWDHSLLLGWGVGAGKSVVDPNTLVAKLLGTTAAHNEYLRIGVDGGYVGLALLILLMTLWCLHWTRHAPRTDRFIMRAVFIAFAVHSVTDNTLIAATASIMFTWISAVFARAALEREAAGELAPDGAGASAGVSAAEPGAKAAQIA